MRYKIKAPDRASYEELKGALPPSVHIIIELPRRFLMSVENLSAADKKLIKKYGGSVSKEMRFHPQGKPT